MRPARALLSTLLTLLAAGALPAAEFIGVSKCKMCHKTEYTSWESLGHARAFDRLKPEEQTRTECLRCHATGEKAELPGVQCEACHGPGSDYKSVSVMKNPDAALGAGLVLPTEAQCRSCHENAPHDLPAFDYSDAVRHGVHAVKQPG